MNQALDSQEDELNKKEGGSGSSREGFKQAFRRRMYQIYFELMKERNIDLIFASVLMAVNFVQIYGLLYNTKINFPFRDDLYNTICSLFDLIRIYPLLEGDAPGDGFPLYYWIISFGLIAVLIIYLLLMVYIDYSIKIEKFYFMLPVKLLRTCSSLIFWVFMMPIIEVFVSIFSCDDSYHYIDRSLQCWSGIHIFYCALFSVALFGFILVFLQIAFFYNESRPYHTDAFARLDTNFETHLTLYKILITVIGHFVYQERLHWLIIVIHILGALNFCKMYYQYLPYYNSRTSVLFGAGWLIYLWLTLNVLLCKALQGVDYQGQSIVIIVGVILLFPAVQQLREQKIQKRVFTKKHDKIKSEYELDLYIHKIYRLTIDQHVNEVDEMILLGLVHNHQSECLNSECPLNNQEELYLPQSNSTSDRSALFSKDQILLYHLINSIYAEYAKSSNSTAVLHSTYAYFLFYQIGNIHTALLELNVADKCDTSSQQKFTIYRAKRFIENNLVSKFGKGGVSSAQPIVRDQALNQNGGRSFAELDVTIVITFESLFARLNKEIEKSANDHIEFWSHLDSQMVDLNVLHKLGLNIINNTKRINELWIQLTRINPNYPKALQIYGNYLIQIKNDNVEGEEFLMKANVMARPKSLADDGQNNNGLNGHQQQMNDFEMMFAEDTAIVVISGNKDSQAKIMKTNNGITKLFGYNTFEVHGHEVNILMPPIIGVKHNYFLESFFKTGRERIINSELSTFAMLRAGHIFQVSLIVKPVPSLKNDIQYIGLIKPTGKDYEYILTDQYGRIDSISKGITSMLQLQPTFFKENEIFVQVICPQLCETERVKGSKESAMKFDTWTGSRDLTFIIPRNFSNLSQKSGGGRTASTTPTPGQPNGKMMGEDDDPSQYRNRGKNGGDNFIGLKSPDHLKKVCNMFRNQDHKAQPQKYMQTLRNYINYEQPEIFKGPVKTDIINRSHGNGQLHLKVFKILGPKKNGAQGTSADSDSVRGVGQNNQGNKNIRALLDETYKRLEDLGADELHKRLQQMKQALEQIKRGIRHPSAKLKPSNIVTPGTFENAEILRYNQEIKQLEQRYRVKTREEDEVKQKEDALLVDMRQPQQTRPEYLLMDQSNLNYEQLKGQFPLGNVGQDDASISMSPDPKMRISANDISAFVDDSVLDQQQQRPSDTPLQTQDQSQQNLFNDDGGLMDEYDAGEQHKGARFKEDDEKIDLLKDIKASQEQRKIKQTAKKKKDGDAAAGEEGKEKDGADASDGGGTNDTTAGGTADEKTEDEKFLEEDTGSVASSTKSLAKHLRMLRNALYENYLPPSINNLKINAKIVFAALLVITIVWYVYSKTIYKQLKDNIENIHSSKNRMNSLTDIGANVRILAAMNQGRVNKTRGNRDYEGFKRTSLLSAAQIIQQAQNNLSSTYLRDVFTPEDNNLINPNRIQLIYNSPAALPMFYYVDVWSAVMSVSVHALSIKELPLSQVTKNETAVFFILTNTLNNILSSIQNSTSAILQESGNISDLVDRTLLYLLIVASASLTISLCLIFPVATKVDKNKDELLRHFMLIDREDVRKQLDKCRSFFNTMHDKEHNTQQVEEIEEEEFKEEDAAAKGEEDGKDGGLKKGRNRSRKNKMHKKYSTNFISLIIKFLLVVTILEGYFILCYFESGKFLSIAKNLIQESGTITMRHFSNNFLYQIMQEVLTTNGKAQVMNKNSLTFIFNYLNDTIKQQEEFLKEHSSNAGYHSDEFNGFFDELIYTNVCDAIYEQEATGYSSCQNFMGGILKKGLYSANVAYWDNMRSMATDFNNSARDQKAIDTIMNSDRLIDNENLKDIYFEDSYKRLLVQLDRSIFYNFNQRDSNDTILFACYIVILFLLYFILWNKFMETTRHSLWVTKSMLAIIPLDIIQKVPKIKDFLLASSKTTLSALND